MNSPVAGALCLCSDILFEVIMFFSIGTLFRLNGTNRRFFNFCSINYALQLFYLKGARFVQNICIHHMDGFSTSDEQIAFTGERDVAALALESISWKQVPAPIYPISADDIQGFHNILIQLPFSSASAAVEASDSAWQEERAVGIDVSFLKADINK